MTPYQISKHRSGTFIHFTGGAVRRSAGVNETLVVEGMPGIKKVALTTSAADNAEAAQLAAVSKFLFGI